MMRLVPPMLLLCLVGCGSSLQANIVIAMERDGRDDTTVRVSMMVVDANGAPAWKATHASKLSESASPDFEGALNVCRIVDGDPRPSDLTDFTLFELLSPSVQKGADGAAFGLNPESPAVGTGEGYTGLFSATDIPYEENAQYVATAQAGTGPALGAQVNSPVDFVTQKIGFATPGPGSIAIPSRADLDLTWAPGSEHEMYVILKTDRTSIVCRVVDNGAFTMSSKLLEKLPPGPGATLIMERITESKFQTDVSTQSGKPIHGRFRFAARRVWTIELQ